MARSAGKNKDAPPSLRNRRSAEQISDIMRQVKSENTTPEVVFRKALWAHGLRYRLHVDSLPGKPDIVIPARRLAIFVDGDFWHGNQWRRRGLPSLEAQFEDSPRREYWLKKIRRNMERDCKATAELTRLGWNVLRFWESDITHHVNECAALAAAPVSRKAQPDLPLTSDRSVAEFFAGIGLMRIGLERQGWNIVFANDIDAHKKEMYDRHFRDAPEHLMLGDIHELSARRVPSVALATASFPCNDLSLAGSRGGLEGRQSSAFWGFVKVLTELGRRRPPLILIENVPGFLTSHGGKDFESACLALNQLGYAVDPFLIDAARFVPQSRSRLFLVGVLGNMDDAALVLEPTDTRPKSLTEFVRSHPAVQWRVRKLPSLPKSETVLEDIVETLPDDSLEWWAHDRAEHLLNQMSSRHRAVADAMIANPRRSYGTVFRRVRQGKTMAELRTDGVAGCLRTPRGGSGRQILFAAGQGRYQVRLLTPRECARLMGADDYVVSGRRNQALFGFGDAVCVPVIEWIAKYYLNPLITEMLHAQLKRRT
ncbi:MAG: DNA mismatch endonuclease Vsr [Candidatus Hydrogenedentes bacterium]|nr:DNA mismatch endonuclease Vsr [Candidatus Hydrogenedentota bacterium]